MCVSECAQWRVLGKLSGHSFAGLFVVVQEPFASLRNPLIHRLELVIGELLAKLEVTGSLFELAVSLGGIKHHFSFKLHTLGNQQRHIFDADLSSFIH